MGELTARLGLFNLLLPSPDRAVPDFSQGALNTLKMTLLATNA